MNLYRSIKWNPQKYFYTYFYKN